MEAVSKSRILLVDNDKEVLGPYSRLLRTSGYDVCEAPSGEQALAIARSCLPDVILLGSSLLNMDSIELCQCLKAESALNNPQLIILSDSMDKVESLSRALDGGADDYVALPVSNKELLARVNVQLRLKQALILIQQEVEAHQATQSELRKSEKILRLITESVSDVLWLITPGFDKVVFIGPAYETIWGRDRAAVYKRPGTLIEAVHPEDRERVSAALADYTLGINQNHEYRIVRPDGAVRWIHERTFPIRHLDGSLSLVAGISRDVTVEKQLQAEMSLRESEVRLRELAENLHQVLWIRDFDRIIYVNPAYETVIGATRRSLYENPSSFVSYIHPEERRRLDKAFRDQRESGFFAEEFRIIRPDGAVRWLKAQTAPIWQEDKIVRIVGIADDITDRKEAEEGLRDSEEKLRKGQEFYRLLSSKLIRAQEEERRRLARELHDDFTQRVAYLAIEVGRLEAEAGALSGEVQQSLRNLREYAAELAQDVNDLSRLLHPSVLDELGLVDSVRYECHKFQAAFPIQVQFISPNSIPELSKETAVCLYRFIQEALRNISKHSQASHVTISLDSSKESICLTVVDNGIGFNPDSAKQKGGLGLASMGERVDLLQGELTIDSRPGSGTVLRACIPVWA